MPVMSMSSVRGFIPPSNDTAQIYTHYLKDYDTKKTVLTNPCKLLWQCCIHNNCITKITTYREFCFQTGYSFDSEFTGQPSSKIVDIVLQTEHGRQIVKIYDSDGVCCGTGEKEVMWRFP
jgi:hypothetical protein